MIRLSRQQLRTIDRLAVERYHIPGEVLMENAARAVADVACEMLCGDCTGEILIVCGGGNNGGDGLAAARHLHNRGAEVRILLTVDPAKYTGEALVNWRIVTAMKLATYPADDHGFQTSKPRLVLDAIFGTGLSQSPREPFSRIVDSMQKFGVPILAVDIPSGMDCDTGKPLGSACVRANRTVTFVAEKVGFASPEAREYLGGVTIGDIGCPRELIMEVASGVA
jgi:NAD(P)H-hydrate epimerase